MLEPLFLAPESPRSTEAQNGLMWKYNAENAPIARGTIHLQLIVKILIQVSAEVTAIAP